MMKMVDSMPSISNGCWTCTKKRTFHYAWPLPSNGEIRNLLSLRKGAKSFLVLQSTMRNIS